jgi:FkbM family methyltransferase
MLGWLLVYALRRRFQPRSPALATLSVDGLRLTLDWAAAEHIPLREVVGRREYELTPDWLPGAGATVVDVGANAGVFTTRAARAVGPTGRVVAIEPNGDTAGRLALNAAQNGLEKWVEVVRVAVGDRDDNVRLLVGRNSTTGHVETAVAPADGDTDPSAQLVPIRRLDTLALDLGLTEVDLIKLDVEGYEVPALGGATHTLSVTRRVVMEVSEFRVVSVAEAQLRAAGFTQVVRRAAGSDSGAWLLFAQRR